MDLGTKNANDLISKDRQVSKAAARAVIDTGDISTFRALCDKSEFLFDFIKNKIVENLCCAVNPENFQNIFKFIKIYNRDFEDFIIKSWLKFANEDLTDEILNLFENGTDEEKAYAAAYFCIINDTLALEYLNKEALSDYEPLAENSARALRAFNDKTLFNKALSIISDDTKDDFEKYKYVNFLTAYGDREAFKHLYNYMEKTYTKGFVASSILYLTGLFDNLEACDIGSAVKIFDILLDSYPEEISPETVLDFGVLNFIKHLSNGLKEQKNPYVQRVLLKAKHKFNLIAREDIYTFDLSKEAKRELGSISDFINTLNFNLFEGFEDELASDDRERTLEALNVANNFGKVEFSGKIAEIILTTGFEDVVSEGLKVLKTFNRLSLVNKDEVLNKIENKNLKALAESYFNQV